MMKKAIRKHDVNKQVNIDRYISLSLNLVWYIKDDHQVLIFLISKIYY